MLAHAVVPIKPISLGKQRLAAALSARDRRVLIVAMLGHVIDVLADAPQLDAIDVLTNDPSLVPLSCRHMPDTGRGLNAALSIVAETLESHCVDTLLILPADLPLLCSCDIEALFDAARTHSVVIAPDAAETGTNALLIRPPTLIAPRFGYHSFRAHMNEARASRASVKLVRRRGLQRDIDLPTDLVSLLESPSSQLASLPQAVWRAS